MLHGQVEAIVPDFLELVFVVEVVLGDLEIAADSLLPVTVVLPLLGALQDLLPRLIADLGSAGVVLVDLVYKVRRVLVRHTESLAIHLGLLIHIDCLFGLLSVDEALLSLLVVVAIELELRLVEEHFVH